MRQKSSVWQAILHLKSEHIPTFYDVLCRDQDLSFVNLQRIRIIVENTATNLCAIEIDSHRFGSDKIYHSFDEWGIQNKFCLKDGIIHRLCQFGCPNGLGGCGLHIHDLFPADIPLCSMRRSCL